MMTHRKPVHHTVFSHPRRRNPGDFRHVTARYFAAALSFGAAMAVIAAGKPAFAQTLTQVAGVGSTAGNSSDYFLSFGTPSYRRNSSVVFSATFSIPPDSYQYARGLGVFAVQPGSPSEVIYQEAGYGSRFSHILSVSAQGSQVAHGETNLGGWNIYLGGVLYVFGGAYILDISSVSSDGLTVFTYANGVYYANKPFVFSQGFPGYPAPAPSTYPTVVSNAPGTCSNATINAAHQVAYLTDNGAGLQGIYRGDTSGTTPVKIVDTTGTFKTLAQPYLTDDGDIYFLGTTATGNGVYRSTPTGIEKLVSSGANFMSFTAVSANDIGKLAFQATRANGVAGIYTGPNPVQNKIAEVGDTIGGKTVSGLHFGREGMNAAGNVAFTADYSDGSYGVVTYVLPTVTLKGRVQIAGLTDIKIVSVYYAPLLELRRSGTTNIVASVPVLYNSQTPDGFGSYSLSVSVPNGVYDVALKYPDTLRTVLSSVTLNGNTTLPDIVLTPGDANNDNVIDIGDFGILVNAYGGNKNATHTNYNIGADFNLDGVVDIADFGLLVNGYDQAGAP